MQKYLRVHMWTGRKRSYSRLGLGTRWTAINVLLLRSKVAKKIYGLECDRCEQCLGTSRARAAGTGKCEGDRRRWFWWFSLAIIDSAFCCCYIWDIVMLTLSWRLVFQFFHVVNALLKPGVVYWNFRAHISTVLCIRSWKRTTYEFDNTKIYVNLAFICTYIMSC